jgi:hypothetical protein
MIIWRSSGLDRFSNAGRVRSDFSVLESEGEIPEVDVNALGGFLVGKILREEFGEIGSVVALLLFSGKFSVAGTESGMLRGGAAALAGVGAVLTAV